MKKAAGNDSKSARADGGWQRVRPQTARAAGAAFFLALFLAGCTSLEPSETPLVIDGQDIDAVGTFAPVETTPAEAASYPLADGSVRFARSSFEELPAVESQSWEAALSAFRLSCTKMGTRAMWLDACSNAQFVEQGRAREFFLAWFDVWKVAQAASPAKGVAGAARTRISDTGLATGYYEPLLNGSRRRHGVYQHAIFSVPDDLVAVELESQYPQLKGLRLRGKLKGRKIVPYDTRAGIAERARTGELNRYAICWVDDPVEAFFLQVQGSGRIALDDGTSMRVGFADQNGHPYKAIANWLVANAGIPASEMSMQRIKRWAADNPERTQELLNANPNFVFFAERKGASADEGPVGAQGVPLTPRASIAVDRRYWPLGMPFVIEANQQNPAMSFARAVVAQDTGSAIRGVLRFDYFWGFGEAAGRLAGGQKSSVRAWLLMPKGEDPRMRM